MRGNKIIKNIAKILSFVIGILFISTLNVKAADTIDTSDTTKTVTLTGYVIDEHCFAKKKADPGKDSKMCFLMKVCIKGGYGIAVPQSDGSYQFYYFDGNFFTNTDTLDGTDGQKLAYDIGANTTRKDHLSVTVTGHFTGETKPGVSATTVNYNVLKVDSIKETDTNDVTGYLVDESYFASNFSNPSTETKEELLAETAAKSGYGVAVPQSDGSFKFYYLHGDVYSSLAAANATGGQSTAYSTISASTNSSKISVNIKGAFAGAIKTSSTDGKTYPVVDVHGLTEVSSSNVDNIINQYSGTNTNSVSTSTPSSDNSGKTTVKLSDSAIGTDLNVNNISSGSQAVTLSDSVSAVLPKDFLSSTQLSSIGSLKLAYDKASVTTENNKIINKYGYKAISNIYDFGLLATDNSGNQSLISSFNKDVTLTISLTDAELNGVNKSKLKVLYLNEANGSVEALPTSIEGNKITFSTGHFSKYLIAEVQEPASTASTKTSDNNNLNLALILVLSTSVFLLASVVRARRIHN